MYIHNKYTNNTHRNVTATQHADNQSNKRHIRNSHLISITQTNHTAFANTHRSFAFVHQPTRTHITHMNYCHQEALLHFVTSRTRQRTVVCLCLFRGFYGCVCTFEGSNKKPPFETIFTDSSDSLTINHARRFTHSHSAHAKLSIAQSQNRTGAKKITGNKHSRAKL